jgi:hypothetical protein
MGRAEKSIMKLLTVILVPIMVSCSSSKLNRDALPKNVSVSGSDAQPSRITYPSRDQLIRSIDFQNFTYEWTPRWDDTQRKIKNITLKDGEMDANILPDGRIGSLGFSLLNVTFGDLTGDNSEEAVVTLATDSGGNSMTHVVFTYTWANKTVKMLWVHETGDRAEGGLRNIYIVNGNLVIEQYDLERTIINGEEISTTGYCCPKTFTRLYYKWDGHDFKKTKSEVMQNEFGNARILLGR